MYESKYKNKISTNIDNLQSFLNLIADLNEEIELFAIGGTAMILAKIKETTKDIDFLTTTPYKKIKKLFELAGLKEKSSSQLCNIWYLKDIRVDLFFNEFILGLNLPSDWKQISIEVKTINKIKLYILNWYDIIISKIARSEHRDIEDIIKIIKSQKINFEKLKKRYYLTAPTSIISDHDIKFKHLEGKIKNDNC